MLPVFATSALALILAPPALRGSPAARHRWPLLMSEDAACTIIGEEAGPEGKVWFACDDDDSSAVGGAECAEESFGTGGGLSTLPNPNHPDLNSHPNPYPDPDPNPRQVASASCPTMGHRCFARRQR